MYSIYEFLTSHSTPLLNQLLKRRLEKGKENPDRLQEKKGIAGLARPEGHLLWIHAASVGEAQSTLILVDRLLAAYPKLHILVTTGTLTSSKIMSEKLPARAFHQFYPLDHPQWTEKFLNHWHPEMILWMESELWPNMLTQIKQRNIPAILINARLSPHSYKVWKFCKSFVYSILSTFHQILCQTEKDALYFSELGGKEIIVTDNIKFSAVPLGFQKTDIQELAAKIGGRPCWVFASTHKGEEEMACRIHEILKILLPDLLTIIVPRHPERREEIARHCSFYNLKLVFRGEHKRAPDWDDDVYIVDTLSELGLFYRLAPVACIGRSFSDDGGGGHNPIEAAQLGCAVLHGPNVQNLQDVYNTMNIEGAALLMTSELHLKDTLQDLLMDQDKLKTIQTKAINFAKSKTGVIDKVMEQVTAVIARDTKIESSDHNLQAKVL